MNFLEGKVVKNNQVLYYIKNGEKYFVGHRTAKSHGQAIVATWKLQEGPNISDELLAMLPLKGNLGVYTMSRIVKSGNNYYFIGLGKKAYKISVNTLLNLYSSAEISKMADELVELDESVFSHIYQISEFEEHPAVHFDGLLVKGPAYTLSLTGINVLFLTRCTAMAADIFLTLYWLLKTI